MEARQHSYVNVEDYLRGERDNPVRREYVGGMLYALAGASARHNQLVSNLVLRLRLAAAGSGCRVFANDMLVQAAPDLFYYPDVVVLCDPTDDHPLVKQQPCVVFEVLSRTTAAVDRREKLRAYRNMGSVRAVVLVRQDVLRVESHARQDDGTWRPYVFIGDGALPVPCLRAELTLSDIYEDVFSIPTESDA